MLGTGGGVWTRPAKSGLVPAIRFDANRTDLMRQVIAGTGSPPGDGDFCGHLTLQTNDGQEPILLGAADDLTRPIYRADSEGTGIPSLEFNSGDSARLHDLTGLTYSFSSFHIFLCCKLNAAQAGGRGVLGMHPTGGSSFNNPDGWQIQQPNDTSGQLELRSVIGTPNTNVDSGVSALGGFQIFEWTHTTTLAEARADNGTIVEDNSPQTNDPIEPNAIIMGANTSFSTTTPSLFSDVMIAGFDIYDEKLTGNDRETAYASIKNRLLPREPYYWDYPE